jgi:putative membrane protein
MNFRLTPFLALALPAIALSASSSPDSAFYKHAAEGGMAEVQLGTLAQQKSSNAEVKDFGAMMVKDHTAANDKLKSIAASKGISLPSDPSVGQMATKAKLEVLSGSTFDQSYIKAMVKDHEETLKEFKKEASAGQDSDAKAFAAATSPTIQAHLTRIKAVAADLGVSAD